MISLFFRIFQVPATSFPQPSFKFCFDLTTVTGFWSCVSYYIIQLSFSLPILSSLTIDDRGNSKISYNRSPAIALYSRQETINASAVLLDTGNFVLSERSSGRRLWQSFDYPTDALLPGMKVGVKPENRTYLVSKIMERRGGTRLKLLYLWPGP